MSYPAEDPVTPRFDRLAVGQDVPLTESITDSLEQSLTRLSDLRSTLYAVDYRTGSDDGLGTSKEEPAPAKTIREQSRQIRDLVYECYGIICGIRERIG